jgi:hypothetical protein
VGQRGYVIGACPDKIRSNQITYCRQIMCRRRHKMKRYRSRISITRSPLRELGSSASVAPLNLRGARGSAPSVGAPESRGSTQLSNIPVLSTSANHRDSHTLLSNSRVPSGERSQSPRGKIPAACHGFTLHHIAYRLQLPTITSSMNYGLFASNST